jgi:serine/threonine protein kinase
MAHPQVPGYRIVDLLSRGGFGVVYRAVQLTVDREVAIKIDSRMVLDERDRRRFLRETRAAGRLSGHPHVVALHDAGVLDDGRPYLVMELCTGGSLADRLNRSGPMPPGAACDLGAKIADALAAAHSVDVLHRDIKPANILINRYGVPGLADFGLAVLAEQGRQTSATLLALTPAYAAPEAFRRQTPAELADVYSLGATLYTLMSGRPPRFPAVGEPSIDQIIRLHEQPVPAIPGVPDETMAVLVKALATDPERRYPTAAAFRDALSARATTSAHFRIAPTEDLSPTESLGFGPQRDENTTLAGVDAARHPAGFPRSDRKVAESAPPARPRSGSLILKKPWPGLFAAACAAIALAGGAIVFAQLEFGGEPPGEASSVTSSSPGPTRLVEDKKFGACTFQLINAYFPDEGRQEVRTKQQWEENVCTFGGHRGSIRVQVCFEDPESGDEVGCSAELMPVSGEAAAVSTATGPEPKGSIHYVEIDGMRERFRLPAPR